MSAPTVETARLVLRPWRESDLDDYTTVLTSEEVRSALHLPETTSRRDAWLQMAMWTGQWELRGTGQWALEERETGAFLGRVGLHWPENPDGLGVEVGWALHPDHWGKGYATEAGAAALDYAFGTLGCGEVWSFILPENHRSQAVAARLGLSFVELRTLSFFPSMPHGMWRIEAARWHARRSLEDARGPTR